MTRARQLILAAAIFALIVGLPLVGYGWDRSLHVMLIGLTIILAAGMTITGALTQRLISSRIRVLDDVYEEGKQLGRNRGYWEGRRAGRPVVVPMRCPHCGEALDGERTGT